MKKFVSMICALICVLMVTGCDISFEAKSIEFPAENEQELLNVVRQNADFLSSLKDEEIEEYIVQFEEGGEDYAGVTEMIKSFQGSKEELGEFDSLSDSKYYNGDEDGQYLAEIQSKYAKRDCKIKCTFTVDEKTATANMVTMSFEPVYSLGETLQKAAMNTALGMGTVFIVLIIIALIISSFKIIYNIQNASAAKEKAKVVESNKNKIKEAEVSAPVVNENLNDDSELVAVIAAAIAAYEGDANSDGFVVRSIRKIR